MLEFLSDIELYYSKSINIDENTITLEGDEFYHAVKVMRNKNGGKIFITDGGGIIYSCLIKKILDNQLTAEVLNLKKYENRFENFTFCVTPLKNPDRFKFLLEKSVELGIKHFIIYNSQHSISRIRNIDRMQKILVSAMKQSLRTFVPDINVINKFDELQTLDGEKFLFHQNGNKWFDVSLLKNELKYFFIFGPEGGFSQAEISAFNESYLLSENRLRTETAVIKCASILSHHLVIDL